jgi:hypothetical protein
MRGGFRLPIHDTPMRHARVSQFIRVSRRTTHENTPVGLVVNLSIEPMNILVGNRRVYVTATASESDVRPAEMGEVYVIEVTVIRVPVDNQPGDSTTAYDRVDDRSF